MKALSAILTLGMLLLLTACANLESQRGKQPVSLNLTNRLEADVDISKCLWDSRTDTYYVMEQGRPYIHIYKGGAKVNSVGGFGNESTQFQRLSDIALDPDGNLLALDSFAKRIRKYDYSGKWIADIDITFLSIPEYLCATPEGDLLVYDASSREIDRISSLDRRIMYSFGRFQIDSVQSIFASREFVTVISSDGENTVLFTAMGQYIKTVQGQMVVDRFENQYLYNQGAISLENGFLRYPLGYADNSVKLAALDTALILVHGRSVQLLTPQWSR